MVAPVAATDVTRTGRNRRSVRMVKAPMVVVMNESTTDVGIDTSVEMSTDSEMGSLVADARGGDREPAPRGLFAQGARCRAQRAKNPS